MANEQCFCGAPISGKDHDERVDSWFAHMSEAHSEFGLTRTAVANYVDATDRMTGSTERLPSIGPIEVHPVTTDRIPDALRFFDHDAFADNPRWAACYCMFFHRDDPQANGDLPWQENREDLAGRLREQKTWGYLAYVDGKPAGWCNASLRSAFPTRRKGEGDEETGVVACFVIAPPYRGHGVAKNLLNAALEGFRARGVKKVEAHPYLDTKDEYINYHGPLALYEQAGFKELQRNEKTALVTKDL